MSELRLAYNTNGLAHHRLEDAVDLVADLGFDGLALTPDVQHLDPFRATAREVEALAAHLERRGLAVCIQTGARFVLDPARKHFPTLLEDAPDDRRTRLDYLVRCLDIGRDLGARVLAFWSGRAPSGTPTVELDARLAEGCRAVAEAAEERGMATAFEPEPGMYVETVAQWTRLEHAVGHPAFRLALDVGHVHCNREGDPADIVRAHAASLADVQVEDMRAGEHLHLPFGEGTLDVGPTLRALVEAGFSELVSVELSRDSHRAPDVARRAIEHLRDRLS
jgi:sugar phosphate isomerase/epimerase